MSTTTRPLLRPSHTASLALAALMTMATPTFAADTPPGLSLPDGNTLPLPPSATTACRGENVGRVLGGLLGAAIGREIVDKDSRTLGTVGGALAGIWLGGTIGREVDAGQPGCAPRDAEAKPSRPAPEPAPGGPLNTAAPQGT